MIGSISNISNSKYLSKVQTTNKPVNEDPPLVLPQVFQRLYRSYN